MITKNYIYALSSYNGIWFSNGGEFTDGDYAAYKDINGNVHTITDANSHIMNNIADSIGYNTVSRTDLNTELENVGSLNSSLSYIYLGSGNTEPTYDDYTLESVIPMSNFSVKDFNIVRNNDFNTLFTITSTFENISNNNIEISEIGWYKTSNRDNIVLLMARDIFDTIIMKPGEVRSFVMTIK